MAWRDTFGRLARTIETVFPSERDLDALLKAKRPLRVKLGLTSTCGRSRDSRAAAASSLRRVAPLLRASALSGLVSRALLVMVSSTSCMGLPARSAPIRPSANVMILFSS